MFKDRLVVLLKEAKKNHITQQMLADYLKVDKCVVSAWKRGDYSPSPDNIAKITKFFNVSADYFFKSDEEVPAHATDIKNFGNNNTILIGSNNQVGNSTVSSINNEETELLQLYRSLTPAQRSAFLTLAKSLK